MAELLPIGAIFKESHYLCLECEQAQRSLHDLAVHLKWHGYNTAQEKTLNSLMIEARCVCPCCGVVAGNTQEFASHLGRGCAKQIEVIKRLREIN